LPEVDARSCAAAILGGGQARRFGGQDKGALQVGETRIIDHLIAQLGQVASDVYIVANRAEHYAALDVRVVQDARPGCGALGGIYSALAASTCPQVVVVACDMPFLSVPFLQYLVGAGRGVDAAVPRSRDGLQPLCALYGSGCLKPIGRRLDSGWLKVTDALADLRVREIGPEELAPYDPHGDLFFNVNTLEDYERALAIVEHRSS
jgi:molybdopterin-guanine dinucleotide biosynthesis protein A